VKPTIHTTGFLPAFNQTSPAETFRKNISAICLPDRQEMGKVGKLPIIS
jgi:hypothetical protein